MRQRIVVSTLVVCLIAAAGAADAERFEARLDAAGVAISGATAGGEVVVCGVELRPSDIGLHVVSREVSVTAAAGGSAHVAIPGDLPRHAVWVLVDRATGRVASVAPPGSRAVEVSPPLGLVVRRGRASGLRLPFFDPEVLVVRRRGGSWRRATASPLFRDRVLAAGVETMVPLGATNEASSLGDVEPQALAAGDVVVAIDRETLAFFAIQLAEGAAEVSR